MAVKNIECQLAQGQIGRYLAGTDMSAEAVSQLELHIAECEDCSAFIDEKRKALKEMAGKRTVAAYVPDIEPAKEPEPEPVKVTAAQALVQILKEKSGVPSDTVVIEKTREPAPAKPINWKAFIFSGALGLVLLVMSHVTSNPTALFGERAAEPLPAAEPKQELPPAAEARDPFDSTTAAAPLPSDDAAEPGVSAAAVSEAKEAAKPADAEPAPPQASTPPAPKIAVKSQPVNRRAPRRTVRRPSRPQARTGNSLRVYDENGNLISGG